MINQKRITKSFIELICIDGIHGQEKKVADFLIEKLKSLDCSVSMDKAGNSYGGNSGNLIASLNGNLKAEPMFLCAHMDTIKSTAGIKHNITDGIIGTDKSSILGGDDRAGIAVILEIIKVIKENKIDHGPIEIIFTVCEEAGMKGAKSISPNNLLSKFGFVFDCQESPGKYIIEAPGAVSFKATFFGKSAHAAVSPEKGINAIHIASKAIAELRLGRWDETGMMNIGTISGGEAINVVPDKVTITGETRNSNQDSLESQMEYIKSTFELISSQNEAEVQIEFNKKYGGYKFSGDENIIKLAKKSITDSGLTPIPVKYPGGSDANVFNSKGITALNLGVGFKNAHSFDEIISIEDLVKASEIGLNIIRNNSTFTKLN